MKVDMFFDYSIVIVVSDYGKKDVKKLEVQTSKVKLILPESEHNVFQCVLFLFHISGECHYELYPHKGRCSPSNKEINSCDSTIVNGELVYNNSINYSLANFWLQ